MACRWFLCVVRRLVPWISLLETPLATSRLHLDTLSLRRKQSSKHPSALSGEFRSTKWKMTPWE
jgi:hypothetical protein